MERKCCVLIPAYKPGEDMIPYIHALLSEGAGLVAVVDDGSGASYGAVFGQAAECRGCVVLRHGENRGKGAAIKTGIAWYLEQRRGQKAEAAPEPGPMPAAPAFASSFQVSASSAPVSANSAPVSASSVSAGEISSVGPADGPVSGSETDGGAAGIRMAESNACSGADRQAEIRALAARCCGVITADCDGQHSVNDVMRMAEQLCRCAAAGRQELILGCRRFDESTPARSLLGNRIISRGMKLIYGLELSDTQTGLRAIPNALLPEALRLSGQRYEYELNMLIFARKRDVQVTAVPIETIYLDRNKGSHYRPLLDSLRILGQLCRGLTQSTGAILQAEGRGVPLSAQPQSAQSQSAQSPSGPQLSAKPAPPAAERLAGSDKKRKVRGTVFRRRQSGESYL